MKICCREMFAVSRRRSGSNIKHERTDCLYVYLTRDFHPIIITNAPVEALPVATPSSDVTCTSLLVPVSSAHFVFVQQGADSPNPAARPRPWSSSAHPVLCCLTEGDIIWLLSSDRSLSLLRPGGWWRGPTRDLCSEGPAWPTVGLEIAAMRYSSSCGSRRRGRP